MVANVLSNGCMSRHLQLNGSASCNVNRKIGSFANTLEEKKLESSVPSCYVC